MADTDPTGGGSTVALDLPAEHVTILRGVLASCLEGVRGDLSASEKMRSPDRARRDAAAYERLLLALGKGEVRVPDESAREAVATIATAGDRENDYTAVVAEHDALHGLLARLAVPQEGGEGD